MRELLSGFTWVPTGERQSMLIEDGRVVWRGREPASVEADLRVDLSGRHLLPGFVDAHCHILPSGLALGEPSVAGCVDRAEVLERVREALSKAPEGEWLMVGGYDQNRFADGRHLDRADLEAVTGRTPVVLRHVSGHGGLASGPALSAAGLDAPAGFVVEAAYQKLLRAVPTPSLTRMVEAILAIGERMSREGLTCATDMMTGYTNLDRELTAYRLASERGCKIRLRLYVVWSRLFGPRAMAASRLAEHESSMNPERCRIAGVKVFADGALSSRTAAIRGAYEGEKAPRGWSGKLVYRQEKLDLMLRTCEEAGRSAAIHALGDYATDRVLESLAKLKEPARHRLEHAMLLDDAQIAEIARLGPPCVQQPEFLLRLGPAYERSVGPERASMLNRSASLLRAGVALAFGSDRPVVSGDPWAGIEGATRRPATYATSENLKFEQALAAYSADAADVGGDRGRFGRLDPGEWADYQVFAGDPREERHRAPLETRIGT